MSLLCFSMHTYSNVSYFSDFTLVDRGEQQWVAFSEAVPSIPSLSLSPSLDDATTPSHNDHSDTPSFVAPPQCQVREPPMRRGLFKVCPQHHTFHVVGSAFDSNHADHQSLPYKSNVKSKKRKSGQQSDEEDTSETVQPQEMQSQEDQSHAESSQSQRSKQLLEKNRAQCALWTAKQRRAVKSAHTIKVGNVQSLSDEVRSASVLMFCSFSLNLLTFLLVGFRSKHTLLERVA